MLLRPRRELAVPVNFTSNERTLDISLSSPYRLLVMGFWTKAAGIDNPLVFRTLVVVVPGGMLVTIRPGGTVRSASVPIRGFGLTPARDITSRASAWLATVVARL